MPRIYAPNEEYGETQFATDFYNGAAAIASGASTAYWLAEGYDIDNSKHELTVFDYLTRVQIEAILTYYGISFSSSDYKQALVRKIETAVSTAKITALTVASTAGTAVGDSNIAVTGAIGTTGNALMYKTGADAISILFRDIPDNTWTEFESGEDITPNAAHDTITVIEVNAAGAVVSYGTDTIVVKSGT